MQIVSTVLVRTDNNGVLIGSALADALLSLATLSSNVMTVTPGCGHWLNEKTGLTQVEDVFYVSLTVTPANIPAIQQILVRFKEAAHQVCVVMTSEQTVIHVAEGPADVGHFVEVFGGATVFADGSGISFESPLVL